MRKKLPQMVLAIIAVFVFLSATGQAAAQEPAPLEFSQEDCEGIADSMPGYYGRLHSLYFPSYTCTFGDIRDSTGGSSYKVATDEDADLYLNVLDVVLYGNKADAIDSFGDFTKKVESFGSVLDDRTEMDIENGRAVITTYTRPHSEEGYGIDKLGVDVIGTIITGNCVAHISGNNEINDTFDNYHSYTTVKAPPGSSHYYNFIYDNKHEGFDHGTSRLRALVKELVPQAAGALLPYCGGQKNTAEEKNVQKDAYSKYRDRVDKILKSILDTVPRPFSTISKEENVSYDLVNKLCFRDYYINGLMSECRANKADLDGMNAFTLCEISAWSRMESCFSDFGMIRILAAYDGPHSTILPSNLIEKTTGISIDNLNNRRAKIGNTGTGKQLPPEGSVLHADTESQYKTAAGSVINIAPQTSVKFRLRSASAVELELLSGDVEVKTEAGEKVNIRVPQGSVMDNGTHFWVQVTDAGYTIAGVYEGAVRLKSLVTGEEAMIAPQNGRPGIGALRFLAYEEFGKDVQSKQTGVWIWIFIIAVASGIGYIAYNNRERLSVLMRTKNRI